MRAQKFGFAFLLVAAGILAPPSMWATSGGQEAQAPPKPAHALPKQLAIIGREVVTDRDLAARLSKMPSSKRVEALTPDGKKALLNRLIYRRLLSHEAERLGLDRDPEVAPELKLARENVLFNVYLQREIMDRVRVTKEEAKEYFEAHQEDFPDQTFKRAEKAATAALRAEKAGLLARERMKELWNREQVKVDEAQLAKLDLAGTMRKGRLSPVEILQMLEKRGQLPEELRNVLKEGTILEGPPPKP